MAHIVRRTACDRTPGWAAVWVRTLSRQIIDQVKAAIATETIAPGNRLPTVRQLAVDLSINPNTVSRAYTELEPTGLVETRMGSGTFAGDRTVGRDDVEQQRLLEQLCQEFLSRASTHGFNLDDVLSSGSRNEVQLIESMLCDVLRGLGVLCVSGRLLTVHGTILVAGAVD